MGNHLRSECVFSFTATHSHCTVFNMIVSDIQRALIKQYEEDRKQISKNTSEMDRRRAAWMVIATWSETRRC